MFWRLISPSGRGRARNSGFTLLEVLITAVLMATLMAGVWGLYSMFATLYETGYVRVEKAQLIRSITQQLADDLAGTVLPPPAEARRSRSGGGSADSQDGFDAFAMSGADGIASSADRVGFLGTYDGMRLDVLQTEAPSVSAYESQETEYAPGETMTERSAEIVTVIYSFQPPPITEEWLVAQPGLKRQEFRLNQSAEFGDWGADDSFAPTSSRSLLESSVEQAGRANKFRVATMLLPEVVAMEFRYYDGEEWTDVWDSRIRRALPKAVEVALQIEFGSGTSLQISEAEEILSTTDETAVGEEALELAEPDLFAEVDERKPPRLPIHRFVVHLPQAISPPEEDDRMDAPDDLAGEPQP
ncbi:MAG: type II secretion system protein GspJ [Pirellulaceae bacterium]